MPNYDNIGIPLVYAIDAYSLPGLSAGQIARKSVHQWSQTDQDPRSERQKSCATIAVNMQLAQVQEEQEHERHETRLLKARIRELEEEVSLREVREEDLLQRVGEGEMELAVAMKTMSSLATKVRVDKNVVQGGKMADSCLL
jgi:hypothetical protein